MRLRELSISKAVAGEDLVASAPFSGGRMQSSALVGALFLQDACLTCMLTCARRYQQAPYVIHVNFYSAKVDNVYFPQVRHSLQGILARSRWSLGVCRMAIERE